MSVLSRIMARGLGKQIRRSANRGRDRAYEARAARVPLIDRRPGLQTRVVATFAGRGLKINSRKAVHPAHREMLMKALQAIEKES